jgi:hypothetical protein
MYCHLEFWENKEVTAWFVASRVGMEQQSFCFEPEIRAQTSHSDQL